MENQIGKVLLQADEIHEIRTNCSSCCNNLVQYFPDTKSGEVTYGALKCFIVV